MFNPDWGGDMTEAKLSTTPERMEAISDEALAALKEFLENTDLENLKIIMASLGEKKPSHTVLDTLVSIVLASTYKEKENGQITIGTIILPNQQTPKQALFVDVVAGHIQNRISDKLSETTKEIDPADSTAMFEARQAFVQDEEVIGLVGLLKNLKDYVSSAGISALDTVLEDFRKTQHFVLQFTNPPQDSRTP